jgi:hypothetical protein
MIFRFIDEHRDQWPVRILCDALDVSPAGYYAWCGNPGAKMVTLYGTPCHPEACG